MPRWPNNPPARTEPYTDEEIFDMWKSGDPVSRIIQKVAKVNKMHRSEIRRIIFGKSF